MDVLTFVAEIIKALVWPVVTIFLAFEFRAPISDLIDRIRRISAGDKSIDFDKGLRKAAKALPPSPLTTQIAPERDETFRKLAEIDPRGAIFRAWLDVESALIRAAERNHIQFGEPGRIAGALFVQGKIDFDSQQVFAELRRLRNQAVHFPSEEPSTEQALEFRALSQRLAAKFDSV